MCICSYKAFQGRGWLMGDEDGGKGGRPPPWKIGGISRGVMQRGVRDNLVNLASRYASGSPRPPPSLEPTVLGPLTCLINYAYIQGYPQMKRLYRRHNNPSFCLTEALKTT